MINNLTLNESEEAVIKTASILKCAFSVKTAVHLYVILLSQTNGRVFENT